MVGLCMVCCAAEPYAAWQIGAGRFPRLPRLLAHQIDPPQPRTAVCARLPLLESRKGRESKPYPVQMSLDFDTIRQSLRGTIRLASAGTIGVVLVVLVRAGNARGAGKEFDPNALSRCRRACYDEYLKY